MRCQAFRRRALHCAIVGAALIGIVSAGTLAQTTDLGVTDRVIIAAKIYALVQQYFAHWDGVTRSEVEAAYREYIDQVVGAADRKGFDLATLRFIARLRNGHTQFFDSALDGRPLKFRLLQMENQWVVASSQDSRLSPGTIVQTLNGISVDDFVRESAQYVAASNDRLARTHVFSYGGLFPEKVSVGLQGGGAVVVDRAVPGDVQRGPLPQVSQGRWLRDGRVAYIQIPSFGTPAFERTAIELVRQFASSPNLVVDVRGNGGGATPFQLIAALMNRPRRTWQESTPQRIALFEAQGNPTLRVSRDFLPQAPSSDAYAGRLFLLVDRFCGSACEDFVMPFKDTGRAVVIGETTQGSSGNPYRADLGNGISVAVGAVRYRFPDGSAFEGVGITPDVPVDRRLADLVNGRDSVLERAQELAGVQ
jgi:carboxyl-terminal processing protease